MKPLSLKTLLRKSRNSRNNEAIKKCAERDDIFNPFDYERKLMPDDRPKQSKTIKGMFKKFIRIMVV